MKGAGVIILLKTMFHLARVTHGKHALMLAFHAVFTDDSWFFAGHQSVGFRVETFLVRCHEKATLSPACFWNTYTFFLAS